MPKNLSFSDKTRLDWVNPPPPWSKKSEYFLRRIFWIGWNPSPWSKKSEYFLIRIFWIGLDPPPPLLTESKKKQFFYPSPKSENSNCKIFFEILLTIQIPSMGLTWRCKCQQRAHCKPGFKNQNDQISKLTWKSQHQNQNQNDHISKLTWKKPTSCKVHWSP